MKKLSAVLAALGLLAASFAHALEEGRVAPPFEATLLNGEDFTLGRSKGLVVVINFWASWCPPCQRELPALDAYFRKHRGEGLRVIAISVDDPFAEDKVRAAMTRYSFPVGLAHDADFRAYGKISRIPMTFVVDRAGVLRRNGWVGEFLLDEATLEKTVTPLLRQSGPPSKSETQR